MKRFIFLLLTGVLLMTLQTTLLASLPIRRFRPDLVLIFMLYLGFSFSNVSGGLLAFFLGFLMDLLSGNTYGLYTFTRPLIFFMAQLARGRFYWQGFSSQFLFVFVFSLLEGFFILLILSGVSPMPLHNLYPSIWTHLLPQSLFTGLVTPVLFGLFQKGSVFLTEKQRRTVHTGA